MKKQMFYLLSKKLMLVLGSSKCCFAVYMFPCSITMTRNNNVNSFLCIYIPQDNLFCNKSMNRFSHNVRVVGWFSLRYALLYARFCYMSRDAFLNDL